MTQLTGTEQFQYALDEKAQAKTIFLEVYAETFNVSRAAKAAGVSRRQLYAWRKEDPEFSDDWSDATEGCIDRLDETLFEIATNPKVEAGRRATAAIMVLNAYRASLYSPKNKPGATDDEPQTVIVNLFMGPDPNAPLESKTRFQMFDGRAVRVEETRMIGGGLPDKEEA